MKMHMLTISMVLLLSIGGFAQDKTVDKLLQNQESKTELFNAIQNDHQLMMEFMQNMHGNQHAMMMWKNDQMMRQEHMMGKDSGYPMMDKSAMMNMMHNNPVMMQMMMINMIDVCATDSVMSHNMIDQMSQNPQMMQMMKSQMMMGTPGKGMMDGGKHHMNMGN